MKSPPAMHDFNDTPSHKDPKRAFEDGVLSGLGPEISSGPELFIGVIAAIGTDTRPVLECLKEALARVRYRCHEIEMLSLLAPYDEGGGVSGASAAFEAPKDEERWIDGGRRFRARIGSKGALASLAMKAIEEERERRPKSEVRVATLVRVLKTPEEVAAFREVYGKSFIAIGAYSSKEERRHGLCGSLQAVGRSAEEAADEADALLAGEEGEPDRTYGQNLEATFPLADFFVEVQEEALSKQVQRIIELIFGNLFHAPTRDEYGMFHAVSAGVRSSSLARQVGAAICTAEGEMIALGCNDVPKAGGGLYWEGDEGDSRDHLRGYDFNDQMKTLFIRDILGRLQESGWLQGAYEGLDEQALFDKAMAPEYSLRQSELMKVIEYGRSVHAEMAALMDAAKRGIAVEGCTLYTTTFPCHNCAKHILASGLKRVVYVEPYPKSFTRRLYADSIWVEGEENAPVTAEGRPVRFEPFVGISFRQYFSLFSTGGVERKLNGSTMPWVPERAVPRYYDHHSACLAREGVALVQLEAALKQAGIA